MNIKNKKTESAVLCEREDHLYEGSKGYWKHLGN